MNQEERAHLETLRLTHRKHLQKLEEQQASFGMATPPYILVEIDDRRDSIARLDAQLSGATPLDRAAAAQETHTAIQAPHIFVSYSRKDSAAIDALCAQLRARGLRIWRDLDSLPLGRLTTQEIQGALSEVDAVILYLTRESLKSDYILSVELPAVIKRHSDASGFPIISLLDGVSFNQIDRATRATGRRLGDFNAVRLASGADTIARDAEFGRVARQVLESVLPGHLRRLRPGQAVEIDLFSRESIAPDYPAMVRLDWVRHFDAGPPSPETCHALLGGLHDLHAVLRQAGLRPIALRPTGAHLTAGYAFGYVFRATTNFPLWIEQRFPPHIPVEPQWWHAGASTPESPLALTPPDTLDAERPDITIEISINKPVEGHVNGWIAAEQPELRARLRLAPEGGPQPKLLLDGPQALAVACQVCEAIGRYRKPGGKAHIFGAVPVGLAVLIGSQLNALGLIQCYEVVKDAYQPSFLLGEER